MCKPPQVVAFVLWSISIQHTISFTYLLCWMKYMWETCPVCVKMTSSAMEQCRFSSHVNWCCWVAKFCSCSRKSKYDHVTPLLQELHRLPIKFRPQYKIATFVHRFFEGSLPGYLSQTLCAYEPTQNLRSSCEKLLKVPKCNTKRSESFPSAFLHLLSGTLCHPISEILLLFRCLNPDWKLTCSW